MPVGELQVTTYIHKLLKYLNKIYLGLVNAVSNGIQGKFSWTDWTKDVGIAVATSLIVFPLAIGGGHMFGNIAMNRLGNLGNGLLIKWGENGSQKFIETCIKVAWMHIAKQHVASNLKE